MVTSRFNATDLSKLLKKPNACVLLRKSKRHIALTPKALNNTNDSVLVHLNRLVRKFDPELDAVVLGCRNVSILTNLGTIVDDSPHVHLDIEAEFYLFKPEKDSLLSGVVNKKSRDNIGCLVHDIFNVSIPIEPDEGIDIDNISIGQTLTFCVVVVDFSHPIPFIKGKLIDSRAQSPGKQASEGKKRKRSDQLEVCKKIKLEIDSPLCAEDNVNTFTPPIKFPTSILKKTTPFGVESSPARRISFFGDVPEAPNETNTTEGKAKKKKKNEASFLEESPSRRKKKTSVSSLGNEPETEVDIQDSRQIDSDSTGNQKVKKKHSEQTDQVHDFADEPEQDFNILQDFKVHSKKTKNKAAFENSSKLMEADEISKEINDLSASHLKTKKKKKKHEILEEVPGTCNASNIHEKIKKQGSRNENETWITKQNHHDQEQSNETPNRKKSKKSNKMALNEQENTSYITGKGEHSEEKAQGSPQKRKKRISEEKGELKIREFNVAEIINKTVEDAMKSKKRKEKGISEVDVQQNESSVSSPKKQNPNFTNEIKQRKKALRKGKKDPLQTLTSFSEHCATEEQHPQQSILQAVQLTPVVKKKKNEKISPEHGEVSDSRVHEYFGKKDKSFSENSKIKRIINSTTIDSSNRLQENHYSGAGDNGFESLSPIKKSNDDDDDDDDDDNEEEEEEPSGFITSTQIEGSKTKKMVSNAVSFGNDLNEVSVRNSFSDSDSFDVEEFSLSYVPQNVKQKKESKDHIASPISSQERKSQISGDGIDATNSTNVTTKRGKHSDIDNISNNMLVPRLSPFTSKQNMTVQSMNQKRHSKSSGADSSISDSESHSREHNKELRISTIKSTEICSPKSVISKGVQTDEESDGVKSNEHAAGKEKKMYFSDKQMKVQSRTLTNTNHERSESNDADSTDSDLPTFLKKPTKLSSVTTQSGNVPHEPKVSSSNTHKKGTRKSKITDGGPHLNPQKQDPMSPVKKNIFDKPKSKGMDKKHDPVSSSVDSNLHLSKTAKPAKQKQFPNSYQEHGSDSSSSDSDVPSPKHLPPSKAAKTKTQKEVHVSYQEQDSSSSDADLPLSMDVPPSKAAKTTTQKQVPVSHKKQASVSSVDLNLPPSKAAKPAKQKQFPISYQEHGSDSSSSDSDVPSSKHLSPSKADKTKSQKKVSVSHQEHDSSSSDSDLPLSKDVPPSKAAKTTTQKQVPVAHKKQASVSSSVSNLSLSKVTKLVTQKQIPVSYQEHDSHSSSSDSDVPSSKHLSPSKAAKTKSQKKVSVSHQEHDSSSSDSDLPLSMNVPLSKATKPTTQKQVPVAHKKQASVSSSVSNLSLSKATKLVTQKQIPVSYQEHGSHSSSSDSDVPLSVDVPPSKTAKTKSQKKVPVSHKEHDSSSSDSDLPLSMNVPLSKAAKTTTQKQVPVSHKKQASVSSSVSNLPLSKATKLVTQKQIPVSYQEHGSHSSSSDSDIPLSMDVPPSKTAKITQKQVPISHKKHDSDSSSSDSDLPSSKDLLPSKAAKTKTQKEVPVPYEKHDSSSSVSDLPLSVDVPPSKTAKTTQKQVPVSHKKHDSDSSSSDSDLPSSKDLLPSKAAKTITHKQLLDSHKKHGSESGSSDSDLPSSKAARITPQNKVSVSREKPDSCSSSSDSDLPLSMDLPLSKAIKMTTQKQFPVSHKKHKCESSSDSDLPLSIDLPLSKVAKIMKQKQSSTSNKKSGLQSSNSISNPSSHLMTKTLPVKLEPLSPHKSFSSVGKKSSGTEMTSQPDSKISTTKKKDTKASKRVSQHLGSKETKSSGSETNSIVEGLLAKMKTEILDPPLKSSKTGKMEESKKASKEKHGDNSLVHTNERKGKKTNNSKETVDSSKPRKKHEVKEKSDGLKNLTDELLKNMVLRKEKKK